MKIYTFLFSSIMLLSLMVLNDIIAQPTIEWEKNYGGSNTEEVSSIRQTTDGGFIVAGRTLSNDGNVGGNYGKSDGWILKLDASGNLEWEKNYGGIGGEKANTIEQTTDSGYIISGFTSSFTSEDYWILKLDIKGDVEWGKNYGGSDSDHASSIQQTTDGGYIVAGYTRSSDGDVIGNNGDTDYWVLKLDSIGNLEWNKNYGGTKTEMAEAILQTEDNGYIIAGYSRSSDGDVEGNYGNYSPADYWVLKLDESGNIEWSKNYGGVESDIARSIHQTNDGGYIVAGAAGEVSGDITGNNGGSDYWVLKLDESGNIEWSKNYGGSGEDRAYSIQQTSDEGYIIVGSTSSNNGDVGGNNGESDCWVVKLNNTGNLEWEKNLGGSQWDAAYSIRETNDGGYAMVGTTQSNDGDVGGNNGEFDYWIVKLSPFPVGIDEAQASDLFNLSPNPSNGAFTIHFDKSVDLNFVRIINIKGNTIFSRNGINALVNIDWLPSGQYYVEVTNLKYRQIKKLVVY